MFLFWLSKVRVAQQFVIQKHLTKNLWCIGIIINIFINKLQTNLDFIKKSRFKLQKDPLSFYKVIPLTPNSVL